FRALPSGPTVVDMISNAAFLLGLTLRLAVDADELVTGVTFGHARRNFYQAARHGLAAELLWPERGGPPPRPVPTAALLPALVQLGAEGLRAGGVVPSAIDRWLEPPAERARCSQTGATWLREGFERRRERLSIERACWALLERYMALSEAGAPVHTWERA